MKYDDIDYGDILIIEEYTVYTLLKQRIYKLVVCGITKAKNNHEG
jgi:hypothetical protein